MIARLRAEPALLIGVLVALITLGVSLGLPLSIAQVGGINALLIAAGAALTRSQVTPTALP